MGVREKNWKKDLDMQNCHDKNCEKNEVIKLGCLIIV